MKQAKKRWLPLGAFSQRWTFVIVGSLLVKWWRGRGEKPKPKPPRDTARG